DLVAADELAELKGVVVQVNEGASCYDMQLLPSLSSLLKTSSFRNAAVAPRKAVDAAQGFSIAIARAVAARHAQITVLTLCTEQRVTRSAFIKAISRLQEQFGSQLLR